MYTTTVKCRKILEGEPVRRLLIVLGVWFFLIMASLIVGIKVTPYALLLMFVLFVGAIPMAVILRKSTDAYRGDKAFENRDVTFTVVDGDLYTGDIVLDVRRQGSSVVVEHIRIIKGRYGTKTPMVKFSGVVEPPYAQGFIAFLEEQGIL